jgi:hypothetical protein
MSKAAMDENVNIISLGDLNKNVMVNLPACVFDILTVNGLTNLIVNPTHFFSNSETLINPILVTDSIRVIDSDTIPIDRSISDHDGTYVTIHSGYDHKKSFTRDVWNNKHANYHLMKSKIKEVNWYKLIYKVTDINTACKHFTDNFMGNCKLCIPSQKIIIREENKIWFDSNLWTVIRLRNRLRRLYLKNKSDHYNHSKFKNQ